MKVITGEIDDFIKNNDVLQISKRTPHPIHSLGNPHSAKFIPEIPQWLIKKYSSKNDTILDPFVGSGTTMVECRLLHRNALGIDNNPLARLLSKVKSNPIQNLFMYKKKLIYQIELHSMDTNLIIPDFKNRDFWFDKEASEGISILLKIINNFKSNIRDFFLVVLSEIAQRVSKVAGGQILPAARLKYTNHKTVKRKDVFVLFNRYLDLSIKKMIHFSEQISTKQISHIVGESALKLSVPHKINLIVTSPPYINAHHYIWTHKLRLLQLGLIDDKKRMELMRTEIGTEEMSIKGINEPPKTGIRKLDQNIKDIFKGTNYQASANQNKVRAISTYKYFKDMETHFEESYKILENNSHYCMVVGDNSICKVAVPTSNYLIDIAENIGFKKIFQYEVILRNRTLNIPRNVNWSGSIKTDKIIVMHKN